MAGTIQNAINRKCVNTMTNGSITFSGNTIDDATGNDLYFYHTNGYETIIDTDTAGKTSTLYLSNTNAADNSFSRLFVKTGGGSGGSPYISFNNNVNAWSMGLNNPYSDNFYVYKTADFSSDLFLYAQRSGEVNRHQQSAFLFYNSASDSNQTGAGTAATVEFNTSVINRGSDFASSTFTAPTDGKYTLNVSVLLQDITVGDNAYISIITSNRTSYGGAINPHASSYRFGGNEYKHFSYTILADMDSGDTAYVQITSNNESSDSNGITANTNMVTRFSGNLEC